jgi:hypothetical protein
MRKRLVEPICRRRVEDGVAYVETGRSQPSRDMVLRLADALEIPLRERNALLVAAGYAPWYFETGLAAPASSLASSRPSRT